METKIKPYLFFVYSLLFLISCTNQKQQLGTVSSTLVEQTRDSIPKPEFELIAYPEEFLTAYELEEWEAFRNIYESMSRLKELNVEDVEVDLIALSARIKEMRTNPLPDLLNIPQITSRLKVVDMQTQKSRYFTRHYKSDSLVPSLQLLYQYYNDLVSRMISLKDEDQNFETGTTSETAL